LNSGKLLRRLTEVIVKAVRSRWSCTRRAAVLLPIALIFLGSWADSIAAPATIFNQILHFIGSPTSRC